MSKDLISVCLGGLVGGVVWLLTQIIGANNFQLAPAVYVYALLGGMIAAGVATYVPSGVDYTQVKKLFFVSAVAGLSFPSIISTTTNAKIVAQVRDTDKAVQQSVQTVSAQIASPGVNPQAVAQTVQQAGQALNSSPASSEVKLSYDSVSRAAISTLSTKAQNSSNPNAYVNAIEQIGTVPQLRTDAATQLAQLSNSKDREVSAAAKPALSRLSIGPVIVNGGATTAASEGRAHQ